MCEDILQLVDIDKLTSGELEDSKLMMEVFKIVVKSFDKFKPLLQQVFEGLTDDEYKHTAIKEVGNVVFSIITFTITELFSIPKSKN